MKPKIILTSEDLEQLHEVGPTHGSNRIVFYDDGSGHVQNHEGEHIPGSSFMDRESMLSVLDGTSEAQLRRKIERLKLEIEDLENQRNSLYYSI
jgi:hypothetical protein